VSSIILQKNAPTSKKVSEGENGIGQKNPLIVLKKYD